MMGLVKVQAPELDQDALVMLRRELLAAASALATVADGLRPVREAFGLSRVALQTEVGLSTAQIAAVETGERDLALNEGMRVVDWMRGLTLDAPDERRVAVEFETNAS